MRWSWFRIAAAVIALSGIVAGFIVNIDRASREAQDLELVLVNYFSMFTIVSALLSVIALVAAASWAHAAPGNDARAAGNRAGARRCGRARCCCSASSTTSCCATPPAASPWVTPRGSALLDSYAVEVLHVALPIYFILDLLLAPRRRGLPWWSLAVIVELPPGMDRLHDGAWPAGLEPRWQRIVVVPLPVP